MFDERKIFNLRIIISSLLTLFYCNILHSMMKAAETASHIILSWRVGLYSITPVVCVYADNEAVSKNKWWVSFRRLKYYSLPREVNLNMCILTELVKSLNIDSRLTSMLFKITECSKIGWTEQMLFLCKNFLNWITILL